MSEEKAQHVYEPLPPFSFKGWEEDTKPEGNVDFAERWADRCAEEVRYHLSQGRKDLAESEELSLAWWKRLEHLPPEEGEVLDREIDHEVGKLIDALLARAKVSEGAARNLFTLGYKLFNGLSSLAARNDPTAAKMLVLTLRDAVNSFNLLAHAKPDIFVPTTRQMREIPGVISLNKELIEGNEGLIKKLQLGKEHSLGIYQATKRVAKLATPTNTWASRLYDYIENARRLFTVDWSRPTQTPEWAERAIRLAPFSKNSCDEWFEVAWLVILEATENKPLNEPCLFAFGESALNKVPTYGDSYSETSRDHNVIARIRYRLKGAFHLLVNKGEAHL